MVKYLMIKRRYLFFINQDYSYPILRPLQDEIRRRGDEVKWFLYGDEITYSFLRDDEERIFDIKDAIDYNPNAIFVPGNVVPSFLPGLKTKVFHGIPSGKTTRKGRVYHYDIKGMFDLYCTQGPETTLKFKELQKEYQTFEVKESGWCKLDPLFKSDLKTKDDKKTIFFASTFSPRFSKAKTLYPLLLKMMREYEINWLITLHPKMDKEVEKLYRSIDLENVEFIESIDVIEGFKRADMMLCDTSSIMYEFLTTLKPVVTFQTQTPKNELINVEDINKLEDTIIQTLNNPKANYENIKKRVDDFHPYQDGRSSARVLDSVEKMLDNPIKLKRKPLNLVRNFKLRRELGYWGF